jgi:hypothetical protein
MYSTVEIIGAITHLASSAGVTLFYEETDPEQSFPYGVITDISNTSDDPFDTSWSLTIDLWDTEPNAARLEILCDTLRAAFHGGRITTETASGRLMFDSQQTIPDNEQSLIRRQQSYSARIFG